MGLSLLVHVLGIGPAHVPYWPS